MDHWYILNSQNCMMTKNNYKGLGFYKYVKNDLKIIMRIPHLENKNLQVFFFITEPNVL